VTLSIYIRPLAQEHIGPAHALSSDLGWPHRVEDLQFLLEAGHGFAACDSAGELIGTAMAFSIGAHAASLGLIIVSPRHQRMGIGRRLMDAICPPGDPREWRLNATAEGYRLYEALGFAPIGEIVQLQGIVQKIAAPAPGVSVRPLADADRPAVMALDDIAHGGERKALHILLARDTEGAVAERGGRTAGFALRRRFGRGHVIGPVIADSEAIAITLAANQVAALNGTFTRIDAPHEATELRRWIENCGLSEVDRVTAMVKAQRPIASRRNRIFGLLSQTLG
jgi:GNAT superfamily N-acetyltransferase